MTAGLMRYPDDYDPIGEYNRGIVSGEIVVSRKIRLLYAKLCRDMVRMGWEYHYSYSRANHAIEFIENFCHHSKGKQGGKLVKLELWEKALIAAIFGFVDGNGNRKYREAVLIVAKKNGKSLLASAIGLYLMIADGEAGAEVYAVATKKDQAKIIWTEAKRMVQKSAWLIKNIKPTVGEMNCQKNDSVFKPLSSDSNTLDGLNVHGALMDEVHQWRNGQALYDIIADGTTAREQPLVFITSTAGVIREDIYDAKYDYAEKIINGYDDDNGYDDEHFIAFVYEIDSREEWQDEKAWVKANPGLGTIKNARQLQDKVNKAKSNPEFVRNLLCKEFNIRETAGGAWLNYDELNNTETFDLAELRPRYAIAGADLSSTTDLTAACIMFMLPGSDKIYVYPMFWIAEELLPVRINEDKIPYDKWIEKGYIRTAPGNRINPTVITEWFEEIQNEKDIYIFSAGYDSWSAQMWVDEMKSTFGAGTMVPVIQGKKTLSAPMKELGQDLCAKRINYGNNPVLKWCLTNTAVDEDKNGNIQPIKNSKRTRRIDGVAAMLDAYVVLRDKINEYVGVI